MATISFTEGDLFQSLRGLLASMLPTSVEIIRAQINRVPEPRTTDFIVMTLLSRDRLATNIDDYVDGYPLDPSVKNASASTLLTIQLDVHGPNSGENVQIISTLFRDEYATSYFDNSGLDAQALYTSDPMQVPFINGESQWENRWTVDLAIQINQIIQLSQEFADKLNAGIINVDRTYPP